MVGGPTDGLTDLAVVSTGRWSRIRQKRRSKELAARPDLWHHACGLGDEIGEALEDHVARRENPNRRLCVGSRALQPDQYGAKSLTVRRALSS